MNAIPNFRKGQDDGEVDEFHGCGDTPVIEGDFVHGFFGDVVSAKGTTTDCDVDFAEMVEKGDVFA